MLLFKCVDYNKAAPFFIKFRPIQVPIKGFPTRQAEPWKIHPPPSSPPKPAIPPEEPSFFSLNRPFRCRCGLRKAGTSHPYIIPFQPPDVNRKSFNAQGCPIKRTKLSRSPRAAFLRRQTGAARQQRSFPTVHQARDGNLPWAVFFPPFP